MPQAVRSTWWRNAPTRRRRAIHRRRQGNAQIKRVLTEVTFGEEFLFNAKSANNLELYKQFFREYQEFIRLFFRFLC